jgi:hypothetical protein
VLALTTYDVVLAFHIIAVITAYGLPLAAPALLRRLRSTNPRALPAFHDVQHWMNVRVTGPWTVLLLLFGVYMASDRHLWSEDWVRFGLAAVAVIALVGAWIVKAIARLAGLARADVAASGPDGDVVFSPAYEALYARYVRAETLLGLLVIVAIFVMATKP